jgi:hypothetical protein
MSKPITVVIGKKTPFFLKIALAEYNTGIIFYKVQKCVFFQIFSKKPEKGGVLPFPAGAKEV